MEMTFLDIAYEGMIDSFLALTTYKDVNAD